MSLFNPATGVTDQLGGTALPSIGPNSPASGPTGRAEVITDIEQVDATIETAFVALYNQVQALQARVNSLASGITAPGVPTAVTGTAGNGQASVAFTAPTSTGGSPITGYTVTASTGQTATGTASPIIVTGLTNNTAVTFTVTASNAAGTSVASTASTAVTPSAASSAPANTALPTVTGTPTVGSILSCSSGTWTGSPAPTFAYQWASAGSSIAGATSSTYTVQSSDVGNAITCTVTATNSSGAAYATSSPTAAVTSPAPALGQTNSGANGTSAPVTFGATATTAGSMLVMALSTDSGATLSGVPAGWTAADPTNAAGSPLAGCAVYILAGAAATTSVATITTSGSSIDWVVAEFLPPSGHTWSGLDGTVAKYLNSGYTTETTAGPASLAAPVAAANELLVSWGYTPAGSASGWTAIASPGGHSLLWRPTVTADTTTAPSLTVTVSSSSPAFDLMALK